MRLQLRARDRLIAAETVSVLVQELFPLAEVITPNLDEAGWLLGRKIDGVDALDDAAQALRALGAPAALLKGGHLPGDWVVDVLALPDGTCRRLASQRIATRNGHGTCCTLSSAITAGLAKGATLREAVGAGKRFIAAAIAAADRLTIGRGHGPVHHFHAFWPD
jgi:hydroxymethylpyrimidine/phosphomethylpyrimidine kinase